ncbi:MAG TPA: exonuclease domain-containing protein [Burkholderiales bacterium]|nr:exonuclease domain-containing protein [Burkholderiales bacterium]
MFNEHVVFLDLETTGGSLGYDRIIEIGLVEVDRGRCIGEWSTLVNPGRPIPHGIQVLTGITDEMVASAPSFEAVSAPLARRLAGKVLAAHNARFDYGFLKGEFSRAGVHYAVPVLCTVKLSRRLFPEHRRHNLDALLIRHALFCIDRHRALGDARVLWELAQLWRGAIGEESLNGACAELLRKPTAPPGLPADFFEELPESPGVYIFYGANDAPLYVGRSANIRSRVIAHFSAEQRTNKNAQIANEVKRVECIETAGELSAHLRAVQLTKQLAPLYNRQLRSSAETCAWQWRSESPQIPPQLTSVSAVEAADLRCLYGLFPSCATALKALRALADAHSLCRVTLGLEARGDNGACEAYGSGQCRGACAGAESAVAHAIRVVQALSRLRLKPWPYPGAIAVRERDPHSERVDIHVVDAWRYLGTASSDAELHELAHAQRPAFEVETYKILARLLKSPPRSCEIVALPRRDTADDAISFAA